MKRLIVLIHVFGALLSVRAYGQCDFAFDKACNMFKSGRYKESKMQFEWCKAHCKDHSETTYQGWLDKCNSKIKEQDLAAARRRKAEAEAIAKQEAEAKALAERREKNRYVYLSSSSAVKGRFSNLEYELEDKIREINPEIKFTRDSAEAYWFARVVVNIRSDQSNNEDEHFYYVEATVEFENAISGEVFRSLITEKNGTYTIPAEKAEEWTANKVYDSEVLHRNIVEFITKNYKQ